jgi:hypothetical protein
MLHSILFSDICSKKSGNVVPFHLFALFGIFLVMEIEKQGRGVVIDFFLLIEEMRTLHYFFEQGTTEITAPFSPRISMKSMTFFSSNLFSSRCFRRRSSPGLQIHFSAQWKRNRES